MIDDLTIQAALGIGGLPVVIWALTQHIKAFTHAVARWRRPLTAGQPGSPWPLVADVVGVASALLLWDAGLLDDLGLAEVRVSTVVYVGLVAGVIAGKAHDMTSKT